VRGTESLHLSTLSRMKGCISLKSLGSALSLTGTEKSGFHLKGVALTQRPLEEEREGNTTQLLPRHGPGSVCLKFYLVCRSEITMAHRPWEEVGMCCGVHEDFSLSLQ